MYNVKYGKADFTEIEKSQEDAILSIIRNYVKSWFIYEIGVDVELAFTDLTIKFINAASTKYYNLDISFSPSIELKNGLYERSFALIPYSSIEELTNSTSKDNAILHCACNEVCTYICKHSSIDYLKSKETKAREERDDKEEDTSNFPHFFA